MQPIRDLKPNFSGPPPPSVAAGPDAYLQGNIRMTLEDSELWKAFHEIGTEMIITKPGRNHAITTSGQGESYVLPLYPCLFFLFPPARTPRSPLYKTNYLSVGKSTRATFRIQAAAYALAFNCLLHRI
ncbi:hypothetical protein WMY93_004802 [Mugilogobius chulae]|uniref:T-box domain-containing protein n=1 Tax=Mugilogobius chulae TaxID=88201 RepID=A0AAW0PZE0_9GOBI